MSRRIVQCARTIGHGYGVANPSLQLERVFQERGHEVHRFTLQQMGLETTSQPGGHPVLALFRLWRDIVWFSTLGSLLAWWKWRRHRPPQTVVICQVDALFGDLFVVRSLHKGFLERQPSRRWMMLRNPLHSFVLLRDYLRFRGPFHRHFVALSEPNKEEIIQHYGVPEERITVIPNGVDLGRFKPDPEAREEIRHQLGLSEDRLVAIFAGHEFERKGLRYVLQAMLKVDPSICLLVAGGDDPARLKAEFPELEERVFYLGNRKDLERYYAASDLMVMPTAHDISPLVGPEGLASGLPLLMTDIGGVRSYLQHGVNGWLIEQDGDMIADYLEQLNQDRELLNRMASTARGSISDRGWEAVAEQYLALIDRLFPL